MSDALWELEQAAEELRSNSVMLVVRLQSQELCGQKLIAKGEKGDLYEHGDAAIAHDGRPLASHSLDIYEPRHRIGYLAFGHMQALIGKALSGGITEADVEDAARAVRAFRDELEPQVTSVHNDASPGGQR